MRRIVLLASLLTAQATNAQRPSVHRLRVESWPANRRATVVIQSADGQRQWRGRTPLTRRLPPGNYELSVTLRKHRSWNRKLVLARDAKVIACLDPDDQLVRCRNIVEVGGLKPKAVEIAPDGKQVWVALLISSPSLQVFDVESGRRLATIRLGTKGATELAFSADGSRVYASQMATALVYEVDRQSFKVLRTFKTKGAWTKVLALSADGRRLYASNWVSNNISEIDLASGALVRRIRAVKRPRGMYPTADGKHLYVAGFDQGQLQKINLATGRGKVFFDRGSKMRHIVADEAKHRLYVSDLGANRIYTVDLHNDQVKHFVRTCSTPNTIALGQQKKILFVSCRGRGNPKSYLLPGPQWGAVLLYDTSSRKVLDAIVGGNQPTGLDVSEDGRVLVFSDFLDNRIRIYDIPPHAQLKNGGGGRARSYVRDLTKKVR